MPVHPVHAHDRADEPISIVPEHHDPAAVERLLRSLPDWFGIEQAILDYAESACTMPNYLALADGDVVGVLLVARHFDVAAEIHLMAIDPRHHRQRIGSRLIDRVEFDLAADGVAFLQVKTLGPSHPSQPYARTRLFYAAHGFLPLEELVDAWPGNPLLIQVKALRGPTGVTG